MDFMKENVLAPAAGMTAHNTSYSTGHRAVEFVGTDKVSSPELTTSSAAIAW
jgi:hypothetical protein